MRLRAPHALHSIAEVVRAAFATADLRRLQFAWTAVSVGHWAGTIALAVYAYSVGGATAVGLLGLVRLLPAAFTSPFTSMLADRGSRRDALMLSALVRLVSGLLIAAAVLAGLPFGAAIALAAVQTIAGTVYKPAQAALLPQLAHSPQQMAAANAIWTTIESAGFVIGALAGGWLIAGLSPSTALALVAVPFGIGLLLLARIPRDPLPAHRIPIEGSQIRSEALLGFRTVLGDGRLRTLVGTLTATTFVEGMIDTLIVVVALDQLALSDAGVGYLNALWGIGGVAGGIVALALLGRGRLAAGLTFGSLLIGLPLLALAAFTSLGIALPAMLIVGVGYSLVETAGLTLMQRLASDEVLSRVFGVVESTYVASTGIGAALAPVLISLLGTRGALAVVGAALPLLAIVRWHTLARYEAGAPIPVRQFELLRGVPLFAPLPVASVENLALRLEPMPVAAGEEIIRQGDEGDRFFVIAAGEVEVLVDGRHVRVERDGEFFGEIALLNASPRTATVRALTPGLLYGLDSDEFIASVTGNLRSSEAADEVIGERLQQHPAADRVA